MTDLPKVSDLTPDQVRVMVAECCGKCPHTETEKWSIEDGNDYDYGWTCKVCGCDPFAPASKLPDYPNDLNAMAEAEKMLDGDEYGLFADTLWGEVWNARKERESVTRNYLSATASQRAAAFLVAKGRARL